MRKFQVTIFVAIFSLAFCAGFIGVMPAQAQQPPANLPPSISPDDAVRMLQEAQNQGGAHPSVNPSGGSPAGFNFSPPAQQPSYSAPQPQTQVQQQPAVAAPQIPSGFPAASMGSAPHEEKMVPSEIVSLPTGGKQPVLRAVLRTSMGDITVRLNQQDAPQTVNYFVGLARGEQEFIDVKTSKKVKRPFYTNMTFHRVIKDTMIQTGCPFGNGRGDAGDIAKLKDESSPRMKFDRPGIVAMAPLRDQSGTKFVKDTNGSQFFITLKPMPDWDGQFTVFGEVEEGLDVVQKISAVHVGPTERPVKRIYLLAIDIVDAATVAPQAQQQQAPPPMDQGAPGAGPAPASVQGAPPVPPPNH